MKNSSNSGTSISAASAAPKATAPTKASAGRTSAARSRPDARHAPITRNAKKHAVTTTTWNVVSGCPPKNASATSAASPAALSADGRRTSRSVKSSSQGSSGNVLVSGHASQTTKNVPKAKISPATSAPPKRIPSRRPSRKVPNEATNSLSSAITVSAFESGRT